MPPSSTWIDEIMHGIADFVSTRNDWSVFVTPLPPQDQELIFRSFKGDGILLAAYNQVLAKLAANMRVPVVNIAGKLLDAELPTVIGNDEMAGKIAAEHLLKMGHRHFTWFGSKTQYFEVMRKNGFAKEVERRGGTMYECPEVEKIFKEPLSKQLLIIGKWLSSLPKPLGVFGTYDERAHLVLEACHVVGIPVPKSVSVLGVNNVQLCRLSNPGLTSVSQDGRRRGRVAAEMLHHFITHPQDALPDWEQDILVDRLPSGFPRWRVPPDGIRCRGSTDTFAIESPLVLKAMEVIKSQTSSGLHVNDLTKKVGASRRTLERHFQMTLGRGVYDEIRRQRLDRACSLLTETRLSVLEISLESGFQTSSDLANAFRKYIGLRPGEYRERFR